jgi:hypothetical protein
VVTAQEDDADMLSDPDLLERATQLDRVIFSFDDDLLAEATKRQRDNRSFTGLSMPNLCVFQSGNVSMI